MTDPSRDRRHFRRVHFEAPAVLSQADKHQPVELIDLSLNGVLVNQFDDTHFDLNQPLHLTLTLTDNAVITMDLHCVHRGTTTGNKLKCGFRCDGIDLDSIAHLRRLIELNLGDPGALDRELSELIGYS